MNIRVIDRMNDHLTDSEIAAYVDGEPVGEERARMTTHLDACADCRDQVGEVVRLLRVEPLPMARPRRVSNWRVGTLVAASVAMLLLVSRITPPVTTSTERGGEPNVEARPGIEATEPGERGTVAGQPNFVWAGVPGTSYRLTVTTAAGTPVWFAQTRDTTIALPDSITLQPGGSYFWYVDAMHEGIVATTGLRRFMVAAK